MTKRKKNNKSRRSRLDRIERKCDRILSELIIIRHQGRGRPDMDATIERLHRAARNMRSQSERERAAVSRMFNTKFPW